VTSVHQVCHFNLTFGLFGSARHHRMFIANDFLIAGEEDLCLPSKVMDFEAKHKERALGQPGPFICLRPPPHRATPVPPSPSTLPAHRATPFHLRMAPFPHACHPFPHAQHPFPPSRNTLFPIL
jgi:hypothetical protein